VREESNHPVSGVAVVHWREQEGLMLQEQVELEVLILQQGARVEG
jgi:hypothetical protein